MSKGRKQYEVQSAISVKPWFSKMKLNGNEIKTLTRLKAFHGLCGVQKKMFRLIDSDQCE